MASYQIEGKIIVLSETQAFPSGFTKREFVIETDHDKYPQQIKLEAAKAGCDRLDSYKVGDGIKVDFDIRGREYNGKYFVNLNAYKFEPFAISPEHGQLEAPRSTEQNGAKPPVAALEKYDESEEIPF